MQLYIRAAFLILCYYVRTVNLAAMKKDASFLKYLEGWVSIFGNILLFILKFWAGIVTGSIAIIADAWHTLSDSLSSIVVVIGVKISKKPADKDHPFGHGRAELIASVVIGMLLAVIAFNFVLESIEKLKNHEAVKYGMIAIVATIVSIVVKELMAQFAFWTARKTKSITLKADAWHHRSDAISSVIILVGIFIGPYFWWVDGVLGLIVAALIFYAAFEIIRDASSPLLGEKPEEELIQEIKRVSAAESGKNLKVHHIHMHRYGDHLEVTFHIKMHKSVSLLEAHEICTSIEKKLYEEQHIFATIHAEPE